MSVDRELFQDLLLRFMHKYSEFEKKKRDYGTGELLTIAEIHTIQAIGDQERINVTTLGKVLGVTKGSASQMIYKLVDKGLVCKSGSPVSDREVELTLTPRGQTAYQKHEEFHASTRGALSELLREMPQELYETSVIYLKKVNEIMDDYLREE